MHISSPARPVVPETAAPCVHVPTFFTYGKTRPRMCLNMMNLGWQLRMSRYEDYIGVFYTVMFHDSGTGVILVRSSKSYSNNFISVVNILKKWCPSISSRKPDYDVETKLSFYKVLFF